LFFLISLGRFSTDFPHHAQGMVWRTYILRRVALIDSPAPAHPHFLEQCC